MNYSSISPMVAHSFVAQNAASLWHNPGGPVSINPQPLPPRVYRGYFFGSLVESAILER